MSGIANDPKCISDGGEWPTSAPNYGGPYPTRTWSRFNGEPCVANYTAAELDMRRKAVTLQHPQNYGRLTKAQKYSYFAKNAKRSSSQDLTVEGKIAQQPSGMEPVEITYFDNAGRPQKMIGSRCPPRTTPLYNPSTCSDVPGNMLLFNDPSVPLTNWRVKRTYKAGGGQNIDFLDAGTGDDPRALPDT
jgi:hypothetical protein